MITRDNYEELFLLYIDNELSMADRQAVEDWVTDNPDLREELEALLSCRIRPDERMVFPDKETLLYPGPVVSGETGTDAINEDNYEDYFLSFIDGELDTKDLAATAAFVRSHPSKLQELDQLRQTVSRPDTNICFPDKKLLYRKEKNRKPFLLPWLRVAAAAAVLGVSSLLLLPSRQKEQAGLAGKIPAHKKDTAAVTTPVTTTFYPTGDQYAAEAGHPGRKTARPGASRLPVSDLPAEQLKKAITSDSRHPAPLIKVMSPTAVENMKNTQPDDRPRDLAVVSQKDIHQAREIMGSSPVAAQQATIPRELSSFATQALLQEEADDNDKAVLSAEPASPGKSRLRGLFRKVTRTFGQTADRDSEGQREVLIGAFQVAIK